MYNIGAESWCLLNVSSLIMCLKLQKDVSFLQISRSSSTSRAPCTGKGRLPASMIVLGLISRDPPPRVRQCADRGPAR